MVKLSIYQSINQETNHQPNIRERKKGATQNVILFNHNITGPPPSFRTALLCSLQYLWHRPRCMNTFYIFLPSHFSNSRVSLHLMPTSLLFTFFLSFSPNYASLSPFMFQVSVPCTSLFKTVTVRCGHCTNLLPVNMRGLLVPSPTQFHLGHSFFSPSHNLLVIILCIIFYSQFILCLFNKSVYIVHCYPLLIKEVICWFSI